MNSPGQPMIKQTGYMPGEDGHGEDPRYRPNNLDPIILKEIKKHRKKNKMRKIKRSRRDTFREFKGINNRGMRAEIPAENSAKSILNNQVDHD